MLIINIGFFLMVKNMQNFKNFISLNEGFINLINDNDDKYKYYDEVKKLLDQSYSSIGGIKGSGFNNKEDMIKNIPFWKLFKRNDKIIAVLMYKDKGGRKLVASGVDGSRDATKVIANAVKAELGRSYIEKSGRALSLVMKVLPFEVLEDFILSVDDVRKYTDKEVIKLTDYKGKIDKDDQNSIDRYPQLKKYFYMRDIGGSMKLKLSVGTQELKIK